MKRKESYNTYIYIFNEENLNYSIQVRQFCPYKSGNLISGIKILQCLISQETNFIS